MDAGQLNLQAPWFEAYKREFLRTMAFADHETFDYPVACGHLARTEILHVRCLLHNPSHPLKSGPDLRGTHDVALECQSMLFGTPSKPAPESKQCSTFCMTKALQAV